MSGTNDRNTGQLAGALARVDIAIRSMTAEISAATGDHGVDATSRDNVIVIRCIDAQFEALSAMAAALRLQLRDVERVRADLDAIENALDRRPPPASGPFANPSYIAECEYDAGGGL